MKKALGQTVRDLKRGVNKKVLKVPGIERKVLDATSNESWGPHGSHLAEISQASRNSTEFQMIMGVLWKRLSDTGKNWRHVYKALIVLEYLVANGAERVIDEIKEHTQQISTLSEFQYVDSSGRDQGSNVRRKSQSLVLLVGDKERIQEIRQKASANRDKFGKSGVPLSPGGYGEQYEENRNGYVKDDRYGKYGDASSRDGDRSDRESETRYSRDGSVDGEYQGRSRNVDDQHFGTRNRSSERDSNHTADDDGYSSSRGSNVRGDDNSQDGRHGNPRYSDKNRGDPPSYEEAVSEGHSSAHSERGGDQTVPANRPKSPPVISSPSPAQPAMEHGISETPVNKGPADYDEFDPRISTPAPAVKSNSSEVDLLGSFFEPSNDPEKMPVSFATNSEVHDLTNSGSGGTQSAFSTGFDLSFEDPFGDTPFRATPSTETDPSQMQNFPSFQSTMNQGSEPPPAQTIEPQTDGHSNFGYGTLFGDVSMAHDQFSAADMQLVLQGFHGEETDILAGILPPIGFEASPSTASQEPPTVSPGQVYESSNAFDGYHPQSGPMPPVTALVSHQLPNTHPTQSSNDFFLQQGFTSLSQPESNSHNASDSPIQPNNGDFFQQLGSSVGNSAAPNGQLGPSSHSQAGGYIQPSGSMVPGTASKALGLSNGANMQHNANGCLPQQQKPSLGSFPMAPQGKNELNAQFDNRGFLQQPMPSIPEAPHPTPYAPYAHHDSGGFFQQGDHNIAPHGQKEQNSQNYNVGFFHQQSTSTGPGGHMVPEPSYLSKTQQNSGDILQQTSSLPGNSQMNPQQSGSPHIALQGQNEQNPQIYDTGFVHQLSATTALGTSHVSPISLYAPQQNSSSFLQQSGYASENSPMPAQQPGSIHMPQVQKEQNTQNHNGGFLHQQTALIGPGGPSMAPGSSYASTAQQPDGAGFMQQAVFSLGNYHLNPQGQTEPTAQNYGGGFQQKQTLQMAPGQSHVSTGQYNGGNLLQSAGSAQFSTQHTEIASNQNGLENFVSQRGPSNQITSQPSVSTTAGPLALVPQPSKDKFETKSTVWKDTLSRGLVNLNISGSKTNPLADIGIDFDAINRKEKRMEKPAATQAVSTITMGKAMGSGSGIGRAGATALRPSASSMMNTGRNMGVVSGPNFGPGPGMAGHGGINQPPMGGFGGVSQQPMGSFGGMNQQPIGGFGGKNQHVIGGYRGMNQQHMGGYGHQLMGMGMGPSAGMPPGMGMVPGTGMGMNVGQGNNMQQPTGMPQGSPHNSGFNHMASGSYPSQQTYGGGYR